MNAPAETHVKTILIVDDSATILRFTADVLRRRGYRVETIDNVWVAHLVAEMQPDLMLVDYDLGCSEGTSIIRALRTRRFSRRTRFVLYSSVEEKRLAELAEEVEADGYLHKDGDPATLVAKVAEFLAEPLQARVDDEVSLAATA